MGRRQSNRLRSVVRALLPAALALLLVACTDTARYDHYQPVEKPWVKDRVYYFTYDIDDNTVPYDLTLEIRNNNLYPYQNLWLLLSEEPPVGPMTRDTVECTLADNYGVWLGSGISVYHLSVPLRTRHRFAHKGQYTIGVRQGMRDESLSGIEAIGLRIEASH